MNRVLAVVTISFFALYTVALLIFLAGTFGWFGSEPDPLSGVYLIPLGLPWNRLIDVFPEAVWPWLAALAPSINLAILWWLKGRFGTAGYGE